MAEAIQDPLELLNILQLSHKFRPGQFQDFPLRVPHSFVARMQKGNPKDPLLLQVLPLLAETCSPEEYSFDPLLETHAQQAPGLLHKYAGRALLTLTGACPIHCRYCFRRHFPYSDNSFNQQTWNQTLNYLRQDKQITEVILSGGEPLSLSDEKLEVIVSSLSKINHIRRIRFHTRMPVVLPERITATFLQLLQQTRFQFVMVLHINHANEIDANIRAMCKKLRHCGTTLLNQSVLLRRINDNPEVLCQLSEALFDTGILPYYLHILDKVQGAAHFCVSDHKARTLITQLRDRLPGYLVPTLVRESPGMPSKTPL